MDNEWIEIVELGLVELGLVEFWGLVVRLELWIVGLVDWLIEGVVRFEDNVGKPDEIDNG